MKKALSLLLSLILICASVLALGSCDEPTSPPQDKTETPPDVSEELCFYLKNDGTYAVAIGNAKNLSQITIPETYNAMPVTEILAFGFSGSVSDGVTTSKLKEIVIPKSIKIIRGRAFSHCTALESITIPSSVEYIEDSPFYGCENLEIIYCEVEQEPKTWSYFWNRTGEKYNEDSFCPVIWDCNNTK